MKTLYFHIPVIINSEQLQLDLCTVKFTIKPACQNKHAFLGDVTVGGLTVFRMLTGDGNG